MDMAQAKEKILQTIVKNYMPRPDQWKLSKQKLAEAINAQETRCNTQAQRQDIMSIYIGSYQDKHSWLKENLAERKAAYFQGNDIHMNMGSGICFQNSCDRHVKLVKNPTLATEKLPIGSSALGRFVQGTVKAGASLSAKEISTLTAYGIDEDKVPMSGLEDLPSILKGRSEPFLLFFRGRPGGHVINVQCDPKNRVFRFCDDNLGYFDYKSQAELEKQLMTYLKAFYPEFTTYFAVFSEEF